MDEETVWNPHSAVRKPVLLFWPLKLGITAYLILLVIKEKKTFKERVIGDIFCWARN